MDVKALLALFNAAARTQFNLAYQTVEPAIKGLLYEYPSGPVEEMNFPFFGFFRGMQKFTGTSQFESFPEGYKFTVKNEEYQGGVEIKAADIERAANVNNIAGLNIYKQRIGEMPQQAKDHPSELALDMLEVGDASTYGTTFDEQNCFDTTHDFATAAGTQSNLLTGTGATTAALLIADLTSAINAMNGFYYYQGGTGNSKKRKLNKKLKLLVVCPDELFGLFDQVRTQRILASGEENPMMGRFELVSRPFTDTNDWYLINIDQTDNLGLFLHQVEKPVELETPTVSDESYKQHKRFQWSAYGRYAVAYGAWWKGVMVTNT
jgi:phage major head subunit gpT-like protein